MAGIEGGVVGASFWEWNYEKGVAKVRNKIKRILTKFGVVRYRGMLMAWVIDFNKLNLIFKIDKKYNL